MKTTLISRISYLCLFCAMSALACGCVSNLLQFPDAEAAGNAPVSQQEIAFLNNPQLQWAGDKKAKIPALKKGMTRVRGILNSDPSISFGADDPKKHLAAWYGFAWGGEGNRFGIIGSEADAWFFVDLNSKGNVVNAWAHAESTSRATTEFNARKAYASFEGGKTTIRFTGQTEHSQTNQGYTNTWKTSEAIIITIPTDALNAANGEVVRLTFRGISESGDETYDVAKGEELGMGTGVASIER